MNSPGGDELKVRIVKAKKRKLARSMMEMPVRLMVKTNSLYMK